MSSSHTDIDKAEDFNYHEKIWQIVNQALGKHYGEALYRSWFSKLSLLESSAKSVVLAAPTNFIRDWIKSNYLAIILQFFQHNNPDITTVDIITKKNSNNQNNLSTESKILESKDENINNIVSILDPRFTFENFVVGKPNELAYAAARTVAESKLAVAESNPLFLYGGVGLGKTHLMHAISWYIKQANPSRKVIYMSAEQFMYQFVKALRNKDIMSFKDEFRSVDILMIDDIQFICGKDSTQEEFFHTFNALIDNNRQMIISCDRSPSDLNDIEDRIKSRLGWGLVADVHSTTYQLRLSILKSKIEQMNICMPQEVIEFLAAKITSNVRELEGALNKVIAHSTLLPQDITLETTQHILRDLLRSNEKVITIRDIQKRVAEYYNIKILDLSSSKRVRSIARPRQVAMYLSKILTAKSLVDIGKKFGKKDHTTVMHAIKNIEKLIENHNSIQKEISIITRALHV
ncbi:MAG: chromosomal replication initiator protein DnaA [Rickettsiaceae bacterium]|nr:MAG: chromosomal replication initiator protein DnaA [Rickettsiaceae bacterium]